MTACHARHVTLNVHGDLVDLKNENYIDYSLLPSNSVSNISESFDGLSVLSDYSNEIFINFYVKKMEWSGLLLDTDILVPSTNKSCDGYIWNDIVHARNNSAKNSRFYCLLVGIFSILIFSLVTLLFPIYCFFKSLIASKICLTDERDIAVIRSKASFDKIAATRKRFNLLMISEDMVYRNRSLHSLFSYVRPLSILRAYSAIVSSSFKDFYLIKNQVISFSSKTCTNRILLHYATRIALKCSYEVLLEDLLQQHKVNLFTGNKEDRFAMVENKLAKKYRIRLTCIPHGLEYAYRFPCGLAGDIFYCTSKASALALCNIYDERKFVFEDAINREIYGGANVSKNKDSAGIVFFTEPRNVDVNRLIINILKNNGVTFSVKLHPADSRDNYIQNDLVYADTFAEVLSCSVWVSRKSTVLVEALYRGAESIAILVDSKDYYYANNVFPSLSDAGIRKVLSESELLTILL